MCMSDTMIELPNLTPEEVYKYIQLRWKLDVLDTYLGMTCGVYGCHVTKKLCVKCNSVLEQKFQIMDEIFNLSSDTNYKTQMQHEFKNLMIKLSYVTENNPELLICNGVHPVTVEKRKKEIIEKFKYLQLNFININTELGKIYDSEDCLRDDKDSNPLR
jgi:hypothetical protein